MEYTPARGRQAEGALAFLVIGLALAGFAAYNREWFGEVLTGPVAVSPDELSQAQSLKSLPSRCVRLQAADYKETGVRRVVRRRGSQVTEYVLIRVADRWLPAAMGPGPRPGTVVGYLDAGGGWEFASCWDADALPEIARKLPPKDAQRLLPFHLDAQQDHDGLARALLFGSAGLSVLSLAAAGWFVCKLFAEPPGEKPVVVTPSGNAPPGQEWRWR